MKLWITIAKDQKELDDLKATGVVVLKGPKDGSQPNEWNLEVEASSEALDKLDPYFGQWIWGPL